MSNKTKVLNIALAKLRPTHTNDEWYACLSYAEAFALCNDGWKMSSTNLYQPIHLKSFLAQGIGGRAWFYFHGLRESISAGKTLKKICSDFGELMEKHAKEER